MWIIHFGGSWCVKESACNAGDPSLIRGLGRSPGEGISYPLQYSWASLMTQMIKNPLAMWNTWVQSLGWEDPLEEGMATHSDILAWRIPWTQEPGGYSPWGHEESDTTEWLSAVQHIYVSGQWVFGNSLYLPLNFTVNLKYLWIYCL